MLYLHYFEKVSVCSFVLLLWIFCFVVAAFICKFYIFMTYSTSYCCHYRLMDPRNVCKCVCVCVCVCVCQLFTIV
jgi:hypothetical protein